MLRFVALQTADLMGRGRCSGGRHGLEELAVRAHDTPMRVAGQIDAQLAQRLLAGNKRQREDALGQVGSEAAIRVKSRNPPAEYLMTSLVRTTSPFPACSRRRCSSRSLAVPTIV